MIHYHGLPITPEHIQAMVIPGHHAFVSFADDRGIEMAAAECQSFALDNGAFSNWLQAKKGKAPLITDWTAHYRWVEHWARRPSCDFAVIPDVIGGTEAENDALVRQWPHGFIGVPVWHLNESIERLERLAHDWPRVALGSCDEWDVKRPSKALQRLGVALQAIVDDDGYPITKLHGLRMLNPQIVTRIPLASADSTNVAFNTGIDKAWTGRYTPATLESRARILMERIERHQSPATLLAQVIELHEPSIWDQEVMA